ncbi:MAG: GNAT family N-acetyltransferase [Candidatus Bathyarchaeota archaeon]
MKFFKGKDRDIMIMKPTDIDVSKCAEIIANAMGQESIKKEILEQTLKTSNVIVLIAKIKERIVGLITGVVFPSATPPPRIEFLSVPDQESAQKGLYSTLVDEFIGELRKRMPNAKYIETNVSAANTHFIAMYSLKGFLVTGFSKGEKPLGDIIVLRKNILNEKISHYTV